MNLTFEGYDECFFKKAYTIRLKGNRDDILSDELIVSLWKAFEDEIDKISI